MCLNVLHMDAGLSLSQGRRYKRRISSTGGFGWMGEQNTLEALACQDMLSSSE